jgi:hypothetical protein
MHRPSVIGLLTLAGLALPVQAQLVIRAPFVRVQVGGGVSVQAPYVNVSTLPRAPVNSAPAPAPAAPAADDAPPQPVAASPPPTLEQFANTFQPREGSYEIVLRNPVTGGPTAVQFSLPAGTPRALRVHRRDLTFEYAGGQWVRIRFDRRGARVTSRL